MKTHHIYFFLALALLAGSAWYGITQWQVVQASTQAILDNESRLVKLSTELETNKTEFQVLADEHAKKQEALAKTINEILPDDENYTDLTRLFDDFFAELDRPGNPILSSSLRFGKGAPEKTLPGLSVLPASMNLEATRDNFFRFLDFVNQSGSLDNGRRLMEINSIQLNFPEEGEVLQDPTQLINFTVDMTAYYQTPKIERKTKK